MEKMIDIPRLIKRVTVLFFPVIFLLLAITYYVYHSEVKADLNMTSEREKTILAEHRKTLTDIFTGIISDLHVLASDYDLSHMLNDPDEDLEQHISALRYEFPEFITHKKVYDQVRLLDIRGQEIIRVDKMGNGAQLLPETALQNKSDRYYFSETMQLDAKQIFISPFDLNIEHGAIEQPLKPMIRFGTPVFDYKGIKSGMLILNYLGSHLIDSIKDASISGHVLMLNAEGYWLKGLSAEDEWGFMYSEKRGLRFSNRHGDAWNIIAAEENGQFINAEGMFTFATIRPLSKPGSNDYYWKLLSFIPVEELNPHAAELKRSAIVLASLLSIFYLILCIIIAHGKELAYLKELAIRKQDAKIRDIVESAFDAIITIDGKGGITSFNPSAQEMFGYSENEVMNENISIIVPSPHRTMHDDYINRYISTQEPHIIGTPRELEAQRKDGSIFPIELCVTGKQFGGHWIFTGMIRDITERKQLKAELEKMATVDALTGVYNRGYFNQVIENEFGRSIRYQLPLTLIILDIDYFKSVNDDYGHPAGDAYLKAMADELSSAVREVDVVARYGGEEFVIVLPQTDAEHAEILAERIRQSVEKMKVDYQGVTIQTTVSMGIASVETEGQKTAHQLLTLADQALYNAKASGRNRVVVAKT